MTRRATLLTTVILGCTLAWPLVAGAGPKARTTPAPTLTPQELHCQAVGLFAYNRALERDAGIPLFDGLRQARQWDANHQVEPEIRAWHDRMHKEVYSTFVITPAQIRRAAEMGCLDVTYGTPHILPPSTGATSRY